MLSIVDLRSIFDANKLIGVNFMDWLRNLRIIIKAERIAYVLDGRLPNSLVVDASDEDQKAYQKHLDDNVIAACILLASMSPELQKQHEAMTAHAIVVCFMSKRDSKDLRSLNCSFVQRCRKGHLHYSTH